MNSSALPKIYSMELVYTAEKRIKQLLKYILLAHGQVIASQTEDPNQALCKSLDIDQEIWLWPLKRILCWLPRNEEADSKLNGSPAL